MDGNVLAWRIVAYASQSGRGLLTVVKAKRFFFCNAYWLNSICCAICADRDGYSRVCVFPAGFGSNFRIMVGSASGPGSTFKTFLGSTQVRVPLSNKIRFRVGSAQHIYGSLRIFGPVKTSTSEAMAVQGAPEAMAGGLCGHGLGPQGPATTAGTLLPPPKKMHGAAYGVTGALRSYPQEQGAHTGQSLEAEVLTGHDGSTTALLGLDVESGALTGGRQAWNSHSRRAGQMIGWQTWLMIDQQAWVSRGRRAGWLRSGRRTWQMSGLAPLAAIPPNSNAK